MTSRIHVSAVYKTSYMNFWGADELFVCVCTNKQTNKQIYKHTNNQKYTHTHMNDMLVLGIHAKLEMWIHGCCCLIIFIESIHVGSILNQNLHHLIGVYRLILGSFVFCLGSWVLGAGCMI